MWTLRRVYWYLECNIKVNTEKPGILRIKKPSFVICWNNERESLLSFLNKRNDTEREGTSPDFEEQGKLPRSVLWTGSFDEEVFRRLEPQERGSIESLKRNWWNGNFREEGVVCRPGEDRRVSGTSQINKGPVQDVRQLLVCCRVRTHVGSGIGVRVNVLMTYTSVSSPKGVCQNEESWKRTDEYVLDVLTSLLLTR